MAGALRIFEKEFTKLNLRATRKSCTRGRKLIFQEATQPIPVAFYMFSGPDFLYVDQFFPKASVYVLCGKESMGPPPDPLRIANLSGALGNLENAMKSSLATTYFITKDMKIDLQQQNLNGVLPILYVFIARADKSITECDVRLSEQQRRISGKRAGKKGGSIPGCGSTTPTTNRAIPQTLYYFTTDISDGGIKSTPGFLKFCERFGVGSSFLKSSSYLMFEEGFATIRNFILEHSNTNCAGRFRNSAWLISIQTNGTCAFSALTSARSSSSNNITSPKLQELFAQSNPPPLEFGFGYRWNYKEANLMVAERK